MVHRSLWQTENDLINKKIRKVQDWTEKIKKKFKFKFKDYDPFLNINTKEDLNLYLKKKWIKIIK